MDLSDAYAPGVHRVIQDGFRLSQRFEFEIFDHLERQYEMPIKRRIDPCGDSGFNRDEFVTVREFKAFPEFAFRDHFGCF
jgi:hypothetical protein